jgi:hypothetical protein
MATVNITKEFKERVEARIRSMHRKELEAELPNLNKPQQVDASYLYHYGCWGKDYMHLVHEIPKDWLAAVSRYMAQARTASRYRALFGSLV